MNIGAGEAAEQVVRIMLSGIEIALRLAASALKNAAALLLAIAHKRRKVYYGKTSIVRLLRDSRDLHCLQLSQEQFKEFQRGSKPLGILYSVIQDKRSPGVVDLIIPASEMGRANILLERIRIAPDARTEVTRDKEPLQRQESHDARDNTQPKKTSLEERLQGFKAGQRERTVTSRTKTKVQTKVR